MHGSVFKQHLIAMKSDTTQFVPTVFRSPSFPPALNSPPPLPSSPPLHPTRNRIAGVKQAQKKPQERLSVASLAGSSMLSSFAPTAFEIS